MMISVTITAVSFRLTPSFPPVPARIVVTSDEP